jgi:hypothetical protein
MKTLGAQSVHHFLLAHRRSPSLSFLISKIKKKEFSNIKHIINSPHIIMVLPIINLVLPELR